jgi:hypothetical protein
MPKIVKELSPADVKRKMNEPGLDAVGGVTGLYLQVSQNRIDPTVLRRWWIMRVTIGADRSDSVSGHIPPSRWPWPANAPAKLGN